MAIISAEDGQEHGISRDEAADAFRAMFDGNGRLPNDKGYDGPSQKVETKEFADEEPEEDTKETASSKVKLDEEESEDGNNDEADRSDEDRLVTVEINGKAYQVPEELKASIMTSVDYTRKTQALAYEKGLIDKHLNELNAERQSVIQERTAYKQQMEQLNQVIEQVTARPIDWERLRIENPTEYLIQRDLQTQLREHQVRLHQDYQQVQAGEEREKQEYLRQVINAGEQQLISWEPRWKDKAVMVKDFTDTVAYVKSTYGATDADLAEANDSKVWYMAFKAMQHDRLVNSTNNVKKQVVKGKTIAPGSAPRGNSRSSVQNDIKRLGEGKYVPGNASHIFSKLLNI